MHEIKLKDIFFVFVNVLSVASVYCLPDQGIWILNNQGNGFSSAVKPLYKNSKISIKVNCNSDNVSSAEDIGLTVVVRSAGCANEYISSQTELASYFEHPQETLSKTVYYIRVRANGKCGEELNLNGVWKMGKPARSTATPMTATSTTEKPAESKARRRRDTRQANVTADLKGSSLSVTTVSPPKAKNKIQKITTEHDGVYLTIIKLDRPYGDVSIELRMKGPNGYLSAVDWPLLPFYGAMCVVYILYGLVWLVLIMSNWRDILRIQFWISAVILLGMLEKAVFLGEFESINSTGRSIRGAIILAEIVSSCKRALARMLVVIVSLGFGIVKPRLGPMLHRVVGVGFFYFVLASVEGCMRSLDTKGVQSRQQAMASIPLAVLDAAICWWVFTSLVQTTRTLRLRRNLTKLSLYRHFTNTLIFAVLASIGFMIWSIKQHQYATCLTDWKELWVDDAFWHLLFSVILAVIIILWRPTNNNLRYAFSPLLDGMDDDDDDDEEDHMINDAFDGMKNRNIVNARSNKNTDAAKKAEEDLKWIEENIPPSVADAALPSLLDSDEEIMTTKFEISKME